jgi:hypothetical protein
VLESCCCIDLQTFRFQKRSLKLRYFEIKAVRFNPKFIIIRSDVSLFTKVTIRDAFNVLSRQFDEDNVTIACHISGSSLFRLNDQFYEQRDGVAIVSPLLPVNANFFHGGIRGSGSHQARL